MDPTEAARILEQELERGRAMIAAARTVEELDEAKTAVLGRKAPIASVQSSLGSLPADARRDLGRRTNEAFADLRSALEARRDELEEGAEDELLRADAVDVTLPGRRPRASSLHPLSLVQDRIVEIFTRMGYRVAEGPEIEDEWHNFEALNIPPDHPARTMKDSLYVDVDGLLLRTETSAVQIRTMESQAPPISVVVPGRTYRREAVDATHLSVFHQVEGLVVDEGISFADLRGTLEAFAHEMFGAGRARAAHARLLPVRRTRLPGRGVVLRLRRRGVPRLRERMARAARRRDGPSEGARELRRSTPSGTRGSRSAWGSSAWRWSGTA